MLFVSLSFAVLWHILCSGVVSSPPKKIHIIKIETATENQIYVKFWYRVFCPDRVGVHCSILPLPCLLYQLILLKPQCWLSFYVASTNDVGDYHCSSTTITLWQHLRSLLEESHREALDFFFHIISFIVSVIFYSSEFFSSFVPQILKLDG